MKFIIATITLLASLQLQSSDFKKELSAPATAYTVYTLKRNDVDFKTALNPYTKEGATVLYRDTDAKKFRYTAEEHRRLRNSCL